MIRLLKNGFFLLLIFLVSCNSRMSTTELTKEVKKSIQETLRKEGDFNTSISSLLLAHKSGNEYSGLLETLENGQTVKYTVQVIYDGETFKWEIIE